MGIILSEADFDPAGSGPEAQLFSLRDSSLRPSEHVICKKFQNKFTCEM